MIASALTRVAARRSTLGFASASRFVATPALNVAPLAVAMRGLRISAPIAQAAAKAPAAKKPAAKKPAATKKAAAKKPAAKKVAAKKPAAAKPKKKAAWELFDANGKPVPLPHKSKPTRRSAFLFYVLDQFPTISKLPEYHVVSKTTNKDGVKAPAVIKAIGAQWKALSDAEKQPFQDLAAEAKVKYEKDLAQWEANLTPQDIERNNAYMTAQKKAGRKGRSTRLRDPAKPKKPSTAFFEFLSERRATEGSKGSHETVVGFTKQLGEQWKALSEADKEPYALKAAGAREQYKKDMEVYQRQIERA